MNKIIFTLALVAATLFASAQTKQYFWLDGRLMFGTQIASTDSLTYGSEDTDSIRLYLPRTVTRMVTVHDTVIQIVYDTIREIVHDTVYIAGNDTSASSSVSSCLFSVSEDTQVQFSPGNLQYQASTDTWRFAENQYDYIGADNANISATYSGWIDLFCWGTGDNPTKINVSTNRSEYSVFTDWGVNAIPNGGNEAGQWRTMTKDEWIYLSQTRANASSLYGFCSVNGVNGVILLPDDWTQPNGISFMNSSSSTSFSANAYTLDQWSTLEASGAFFLPAAGRRVGTSVDGGGSQGYYWSSTGYESDSDYAYLLHFRPGELNPLKCTYRHCGYSVRLVREFQN